MLSTADGQLLRVNRFGDQFTVNGARVISSDIFGSNGVIHTVERPLTPPIGDILSVVNARPELSMFAAAATSNVVITALSSEGITLFAPSNAAIVAFNGTLTQELLQRHIVNMTLFQIGLVGDPRGGTIQSGDLLATNGVVHVVNQVFDPNATPAPTTVPQVTAGPTAAPTAAAAPTLGPMSEFMLLFDRDLVQADRDQVQACLLYTSPSPRDQRGSRMPSSA